MRILYIGKSDLLAAETVNSFRKEADDIYLLSEKEFAPTVKPALKYKLYPVSGNYTDTEKYFVNIRPEIVVFVGEHYREEEWQQEEQVNSMLPQLLNMLNFSVKVGVEKFIFLSSSHVLAGGEGPKTEDAKVCPGDYRGLLYAEAEEMVRLWGKSGDMDVVLLRTDLILADWNEDITGAGNGYLAAKIVSELYSHGKYRADKHRIYSPVSVRDLANAVHRCAGVTASECYHVAGNEEISEAELALLIAGALGNSYVVEEQEGERSSFSLSNSLIKKELEWIPLHSPAEVLQGGKVRMDIGRRKKGERKKGRKEGPFLSMLENLMIFAAAAVITIWGSSHQVLADVDMMILYILITSLIFGMKQSVPAVLYSCIFYILYGYGDRFSLIGMLTDIETLIRFTFYIFIGVATGYTVEHYRLKLEERDTEYRFLEKEHAAILEINQDNFTVKQEYQKRLLNYKTSLPKLYSVISRLTVLEPERIFFETIRAVKDIMEVETVAVYLAKEGSSYMRLIAASEDKAVFGGKSWNLEDYPRIWEAMKKDEVFIGNVRNGEEPALASPVYYQGRFIAALVIREVAFTQLNLNYTNLFRTLAVMITSSIVKAKDYENAVRSELYLPETDILYPFEFRKMLDIALEKRTQEIADFCVIQLTDRIPAGEIYLKTANLFRNTDYFGMDDVKNLYVLLGNTSEEETAFVLERMENSGIAVKEIPYDLLLELPFTMHTFEKPEADI